jgi:hypothetical protein
MNLPSVFYPHFTWPDEVVTTIQRGPLWPLLLSLHFGFDKLYVTRYDVADNGNHSAIMTIMNGGHIVCVTYVVQSNEFRIHTIEDHYQPYMKPGPLAESKNSRYLSSRINGDNDLTSTIRNNIRFAEKEMLSFTIDRAIDGFNESIPRPYRVSIPDSLADGLLAIVSGESTLNEQPNDIRLGIDGLQTTRSQNNVLITEALERSNTMFAKPKWLVGTSGNDKKTICFFVGQVDLTCAIQSTMDYVYRKSNFTREGIQVAINNSPVPFRLYRSIGNMPPEQRDNILASMTFCKVAREGPRTGNVQCFDVEGLIPVVPHIWHETDSIAWTTGQSHWFMCDVIR